VSQLAVFLHCPHMISSTVHFSGLYSPGLSGGSLALYGRSTNPLVEYYVMEDFVSPPTYGLTHVGTLTSDGSTYDFYKHQQVNQPSIVSQSSTFEHYISIRQSKRSSGTITFANHGNAWKQAGLNLGTNHELPEHVDGVVRRWLRVVYYYRLVSYAPQVDAPASAEQVQFS
jgi:hypothetical protein